MWSIIAAIAQLVMKVLGVVSLIHGDMDWAIFYFVLAVSLQVIRLEDNMAKLR